MEMVDEQDWNRSAQNTLASLEKIDTNQTHPH